MSKQPATKRDEVDRCVGAIVGHIWNMSDEEILDEVCDFYADPRKLAVQAGEIFDRALIQASTRSCKIQKGNTDDFPDGRAATRYDHPAAG